MGLLIGLRVLFSESQFQVRYVELLINHCSQLWYHSSITSEDCRCTLKTILNRTNAFQVADNNNSRNTTAETPHQQHHNCISQDAKCQVARSTVQ